MERVTLGQLLTIYIGTNLNIHLLNNVGKDLYHGRECGMNPEGRPNVIKQYYNHTVNNFHVYRGDLLVIEVNKED